MAKNVFISAEENLLILTMITMLLIKIEYDENRSPGNLHTSFNTQKKKSTFEYYII